MANEGSDTNTPATKRIDEPTGTEFVGHEWDGIEELDTPMPRWWPISRCSARWSM